MPRGRTKNVPKCATDNMASIRFQKIIVNFETISSRFGFKKNLKIKKKLKNVDLTLFTKSESMHFFDSVCTFGECAKYKLVKPLRSVITETWEGIRSLGFGVSLQGLQTNCTVIYYYCFYCSLGNREDIGGFL